MTTTIAVKIRLFSVLKEHFGNSTITIGLPENGCSVQDLLDVIEIAHPSFTPYKSMVRVAVNQVYAKEKTVVTPADEIALITAVSGG